jgi:hypothetical protein
MHCSPESFHGYEYFISRWFHVPPSVAEIVALRPAMKKAQARARTGPLNACEDCRSVDAEDEERLKAGTGDVTFQRRFPLYQIAS